MSGLEFVSVLIHILDLRTKVGKGQANAFIQIRELAKAGCECVIFIYCRNLENLRIRVEGHDSTCVFRISHYSNRLIRLTLRILLHEHFAFTMDLSLEIVRKRIYAGYTDSVKTS